MSYNKKKKSTISPKLFDELASKNVKKSARDYFIYFFTLTLSVCLFYSFNSISTQFNSLGLKDNLSYLSFSSSVLAAVSILVCFIIGSLVVYANQFLMGRRKKEIGIYASLGMSRKDLNKLFMNETIRIGIFSLITGLALGIFFSQILSLITAKMIGVELSAYRFMISPTAIIFSIIFFGILFYFVQLFNKKELKKLSLLELLYSDRKNETVPDHHTGRNIIFLLLSLFLMPVGYLLYADVMNFSLFGGVGVGCLIIIISTFLFFASALNLAMKLMQKNRRYYFRGLNMFTASQFSSRLKSESRSIAMISVLLFLSMTLSILGSGMGKDVVSDIELTTPYDGTIDILASENNAPDSEEPMSYFDGTEFHLEDIADQKESLWLYTDPSVTSALFQTGALDLNQESKEGADDTPSPLRIIGVEDYNRMMELQGLTPIQLGEQEFAINYTAPSVENKLKAFMQNPKTVRLGETTLTLLPNGLSRNPYHNQTVLMDFGTLIVPQHLVSELTPQIWLLNFNFRERVENADTILYEKWFSLPATPFHLSAKQDILISITSANLVVTYLGIYLGITFLITAGAVLAIQQLSKSTDNTKRYALLKKLGASKKDMKRSLLTQLKIYFGTPFILASINTFAFVFIMFQRLETLTLTTMLWLSGLCLLLILIIYMTYFIATYSGSKRILKL